MGLSLSQTFAGLLVSLLALVLYVWHNDRRILTLPESLQKFNLKLLTPEEVWAELEASEHGEVQLRELKKQMPPKTGRRYIVVGGGGAVGGWITSHLLQRGEDPKSIRVIDVARVPSNEDIITAQKDGLEYRVVDISNASALTAAFTAPWSDSKPASIGLTVFHTAANIRFFERDPIFLSRSTNVIVNGTHNILEASKIAGADVLVYTSSIGMLYRRVSPLLWPWQPKPALLTQFLNDDSPRPKTHEEHVANYHVAKGLADDIVLQWDKTPVHGGKVLRTGSLRAGNGIYGPRGGEGPASTESGLKQRDNPMFGMPCVHSWIYNENCSLAHLCFERRLLDLHAQDEAERKGLLNKRKLPDIGGQAFVVTDPGPPIIYRDLAIVFETLTKGERRFNHVSPTAMILLSHLVEFYYIWQYRITSTFPLLGALIKPVPFPLAYMQPPIFGGINVNCVIDDRRARKKPEDGGLGYEGVWKTREGFRRTWQDWNRRQTAKDAKDA